MIAAALTSAIVLSMAVPAIPEIASKVTWTDASGNTYVLDSETNTVTVYDVDGNVSLQTGPFSSI